MKKIVLIALVLFLKTTASTAQKIDSIYVNLYTDSLKKGTYNYINIDGKLSNGRYMALDSTDIVYWASAGKFYNNSLFIDRDFAEEKVLIKVYLKTNPTLYKEFEIFIKKKPDDEHLKSLKDILR